MTGRPLTVETNDYLKLGDRIMLPDGEIFIITSELCDKMPRLVSKSRWGRLRGWYWRTRFYRAWLVLWGKDDD